MSETTTTPDDPDRVADFDDALARAFAKVERAAQDGRDANIKKNGKDRKYVTLASVDAAVRVALTDEGFSYPQLPTTERTEDGGLWLTITTQLRRRGVSIVSTLGLPVLGNMRKGGAGFAPPTAQSVGSALTYGRRYALTALLGVCPDDDDDGHAASQPPQVDKLWLAYTAIRDEVGKSASITPAQAHERIKAAAGITHNRDATDPEVESMIKAAGVLMAKSSEVGEEPSFKAKPKPKAKALSVARIAATAAAKSYGVECKAQGTTERPWLEIAAEAIGKTWSQDKGAHGVDDYVALAAAYDKETEKLRHG